MATSEFKIIERYFKKPCKRDDVVLGIGDDAAVLTVPAGKHLVVAVDTLVEGVHFFADTAAEDIAFKALAVNLSDLAAMGAEPYWFTLSLTLPASNDAWLARFSSGLFELADRFGIELVGGDTTRGALSVTVQIHGFVDAALTRSGAKPGQLIFVSGELGDAALAVNQLQTGQAVDKILLNRLNRPEPRIALGQKLAGIASAAIDISDGLAADLGHILAASHCGASLLLERIPQSGVFQASGLSDPWPFILAGGDDYELCFTVDEHKRADIQVIADSLKLRVTEIGRIEAQAGLRCLYNDGSVYPLEKAGYEHF